MSYWVVTPEWLGERVFILGCGPSLSMVSASRLSRSGKVIAVNDAYLKAPRADILYFCDKKWWQSSEALVRTTFFGRWIVTLEHKLHGVKRLRNTGPIGLEQDPSGIRHGSNSGYQAINLAYHLGAKEIVLVGFDMRPVNGQVHWRQRNGEQPEAQAKTMRMVMLPKFESLRSPLCEAGVGVVNATPDSALQVWPVADIEGFLR